jgi:NADH-quinone oxidoreductase subunit H
MIAYEVFMGLSLMGVVMLTGSFKLSAIVEAQRDMWFVVKQPVALVVFFIAGIAETHRLPFDIPEAESELVAGYHSNIQG